MPLDFSKTSIKSNRPLTDYSKVQSVVASAIRNRKRFARIKEPGVYLDLGCGPNTSPEFCNLDYSWRPDIDVCWDVTKGLPFPDDHVGGIFTEHMLEHLPFEGALRVLAECRRILQPGRVLRVVMPDGELYLREYAKGAGAQMPYGEGDLETHPFATNIVSVNRIFRAHGHLFIWDVETLLVALKRAGFANGQKQAFRAGRDPLLLRDAEHRKVESLYVEAW